MSDKRIREEFVRPQTITELAIDSHAHLFDECDEESIIKNMQNDGICAIVNMAGSIQSALHASELSNSNDNIYYMFGLHPYNTDCYNDEYIKLLKELANKDKGRLVGLGEIGLDYHVDNPTKEEQIECFVKQIKLADELNLPISLHIRDAHADAINILKDNKQYLNNGGIIHCFSGGVDEVKEYLSLGFYISISGAITFKKKKEQISSLELAVKEIPLDRLLLETDAPFLCPTPYRGLNNEPKYVLVTAVYLADLLQVDVNELIKITRENVCELLKIKKD